MHINDSSLGFDTQAYIVALLPKYELDQTARLFSGRFNKFGLEFSFNDNTVPHLSLFMLQVSSGHLDEIVVELSDLAKRYDSIDVSFSGWRIRNRYLAAMYTKTGYLIELQREVVDRLNPLRAETHPDSYIGIESMTSVEKHNIEQYGWRFIGDMYDPHMTIARFLEEGSGVSCQDSYDKEFEGTFDRIALFKMGDSGTTQGQVAVFMLNSSK